MGILFFGSGTIPFLEGLESVPEEKVFSLLKDAILNNFGMIVWSLFLWFILSLIVTIGAKAVKLGMMRDIVLKKKASLKFTKRYLKDYFWKLIGLNILLLLIFAVLFGIICFIIIWLMNIKASIWLIGILCILALILFVWIILKLFFSQAALVMENKGVVDALKSSSKFFKAKKMAVVKVLLMIFASFLVVDIAMSFVEMIPIIGEIISIIVFIALGLWASLFMLEVYNGRKKLK